MCLSLKNLLFLSPKKYYLILLIGTLTHPKHLLGAKCQYRSRIVNAFSLNANATHASIFMYERTRGNNIEFHRVEMHSMPWCVVSQPRWGQIDSIRGLPDLMVPPPFPPLPLLFFLFLFSFSYSFSFFSFLSLCFSLLCFGPRN